MTLPIHAEDLLVELAKHVLANEIVYQKPDYNPIINFYNLISTGSKLLTEKQANYIIILLKKYRRQLEHIHNESIEDRLNTPTWKHQFRQIDYSKEVSIGYDSNGIPYILAKFPYSLKAEFEAEFNAKDDWAKFPWSPDLGGRVIKPLDVNLVQLADFCREYQFTVSQEFIDLVEWTEEVWSNEDNIKPYSSIEKGNVVLKNASESAVEYFENNKKHDVPKDLFLAKFMGFPVVGIPVNNYLSKICATEHSNLFWMKSVSDFSTFITLTDPDTVAIILDRNQSPTAWINDFVDSFDKTCYNTDNIRVCFRDSNKTDEGKKFNNWVKEKGLGGPVETGKVFIFQHTLPKWAMDKKFMPSVLATNVMLQSTNIQTHRYLTGSSTSTIYVSSVRPTLRTDGKELVEL